MREIKFRGFSKELGNWVYGDLIQTKPNKVDGKFTCWINERSILGLGAICTMTERFKKVEADSVGQYTGLKDKNGVEIYECDIVIYTNKSNHHTEFSEKYIVEFGSQDLGGSTYQQTIGWNATRAYSYKKYSLLSNGIRSLFGTHNVEVIGNIYENPELLK